MPTQSRVGVTVHQSSTFVFAILLNLQPSYEPPRGENQQCGFQTGATQTGLYKHRKELEV